MRSWPTFRGDRLFRARVVRSPGQPEDPVTVPNPPARPPDIAGIDTLAVSLGIQLPILPRADLYCAGTSIRSLSQMSLETMSAFARSAKVLGFHEVAWTADVIRALGSRFVQLDYPPVARRVDIMRTAAITITEAVLEEPPVTFLVPGSPVRHVWLTSLLRDWAERENLEIHVIHGISSTLFSLFCRWVL